MTIAGLTNKINGFIKANGNKEITGTILNEVLNDVLNFSANNSAINDIYDASTGQLLIKGAEPLNVAENVGQVYLVLGSGSIVGDNVELSVTDGMLIRRYQPEGIEYEVIYTPSVSMYEQLDVATFNSLKDSNTLSIGKWYKVMSAYEHPILGSLDIVCQANSTSTIDGSRSLAYNNASCPFGANIYTNVAFSYGMIFGGFILLNNEQVSLINSATVQNQIQSSTKVVIGVGNKYYASQILKDATYTANYQMVQLHHVFDLKNQVFGRYYIEDSTFIPNRELYTSIAGVPDTSYDVTQGFLAYRHIILDTNTGNRYLCISHAEADAIWMPLQGRIGYGDDSYTPTISFPSAYIGGVEIETLHYNVEGKYCHLHGTLSASIIAPVASGDTHNISIQLPIPISGSGRVTGSAVISKCASATDAANIHIVYSTELNFQIQGSNGIGLSNDIWIQFSASYEIAYND